MDTLINTLKKVNQFLWKINILVILLSIIIIAFVNVDLGFITIIGLGVLNVIYLIMSLVAVFKHQYKKSLIISIVNLIMIALAYYIGVLILLN